VIPENPYTAIGRQIREAALQEIGVPVSVGIAPTKTLAKMCNKLAKKYNGVCNWQDIDQTATLAAYPVGDIWGIGRAKTKFLESHGVRTALDLKNYPLDKAKSNLTVTGYNTVRELSGIRCIEQTERKERQSVIVSRSFQTAVFDLPTISGVLTQFIQEAVKRLREEKIAAKYATVWLMTNAYAAGDQYFNSATAEFNEPTNYFPQILKTALPLLESIYRPGYRYRKAMIGLFGLVKQSDIQQSIFEEANEQSEKRERLSQSLDAINNRWGRGVLTLGTSGIAAKNTDGTFAPWEMKREMLSPCYTTNINDIPEAY
jgi:DNA polymerase V